MSQTNGHCIKEATVELLGPLEADSPFVVELLEQRCQAGFPSPAEEHIETNAIDLNEYLTKHSAARFLMRVRGDSMQDAGIHDGSLSDRSASPTHKDIVVAEVNGELGLFSLRSMNEPVMQTA